MNPRSRGPLGLVVRKIISLSIVMILVLTVEFIIFRVGLGPEGYLRGVPPNPGFTNTLPSELHFDKPIVIQYFYYLADMLSGKGVFDTPSRVSHRDVGEVTSYSFPLTLMLYGLSAILSMFFGFLAALFLSRKNSRSLRFAGSTILVSIWAVPIVLVGVFISLQVVNRFSIDWGYGFSPDRAEMGWAEGVFDDLKHRLFPSLTVVICSFGGFALIALQGMRNGQVESTQAVSDSPQWKSFSAAIISVMPSIRLNLALIMSFVVLVEVFWSTGGLGSSLVRALSFQAAGMAEASLWLMLVVVMLTGFLIDLAFSLLALRSSRASRTVNQPLSQQADASVSAMRVGGPFLGRVFADLRWFVVEFLKSTSGRVGSILFLVMLVLAIVGPFAAKPYDFQVNSEPDPVSQFLVGSRDPFIWTYGVLLFTLTIGFTVGLLALPLGRFSYPITLVAECFLVFPIMGIVMIAGLATPRFYFYHFTWFLVLFTALVTWAPVALAILRQSNSAREFAKNERHSLTGIAMYKAILSSGARSTLPDAVGALKNSTIVGALSILLFSYIFFNGAYSASWSGMIAYSMNFMKIEEISLWWILPAIGSIVLISGLYMILQATQDILEMRIRPKPVVIPATVSAP